MILLSAFKVYRVIWGKKQNILSKINVEGNVLNGGFDFLVNEIKEILDRIYCIYSALSIISVMSLSPKRKVMGSSLT